MSLTDTQLDDVLWSARTGDVEAWNEIINQVDIHVALSASNDMGNSALHYAAANGHLDLMQQVLPKTNLDMLLSRNEAGNTPLHWAAFNGHLEVAESLVNRIEALETQDEPSARRLREQEDRREHERHAEKNKDTEGESEDARKAELAHHDELQSERALWDVRNKAGRGPMSEAQMSDREGVVQMLLRHLSGEKGTQNSTDAGSASESAPTVDVESLTGKLSVSDT